MKFKSILLLLSLALMTSAATAAETNTLFLKFERSQDGTNWTTMGTSGIKRVSSTNDTQFYRTALAKEQDQSEAPEGYTIFTLTFQSSATPSGPYTNLFVFPHVQLDACQNEKVRTSLTIKPYTP